MLSGSHAVGGKNLSEMSKPMTSVDREVSSATSIGQTLMQSTVRELMEGC